MNGNSLCDQEEILRKACTHNGVKIIGHIQSGVEPTTFALRMNKPQKPSTRNNLIISAFNLFNVWRFVGNYCHFLPRSVPNLCHISSKFSSIYEDAEELTIINISVIMEMWK